ncbi:MAG: hypothetical protein ABF272_02610, partial [Flavobacteriales bacterium]
YQAAIKSKELQINKIFSNNVQSLAFDVYSDVKVEYKNIYTLQDLADQGTYIFVKESELKGILETYEEKTLLEFKHHSATNLSLKFLLKDSREQTLEKFYLVKI